jgi:hypothetical protein
VADLAGEAAGSAVDGAVDHDAGADAGADAEVDEVADVAQRPAIEDPGSRRPDVVLDRHGHPQDRLESIAERKPVPAQVDGQRDDAGRGVDPAGDADADRAHVPDRRAGVGEGRVDGAAIWPAASSGSPTEVGIVWRLQTSRAASTTRTAILLPPTSTPTNNPPGWPSAVAERRWVSAPVVVIGPGSGRAHG